MKRIGQTSKLLLVLAVIGVYFIGSSVNAAPSGGIGGRPAKPDPNNPRSQSIFINTINRGDSAEDAVQVANNSDRERTIELYAVDGVVTNTGAYTCRQQSEPLMGSGKWIELSKKEVTLAPATDEEIPFTVNVPDNADVGEHNACLVFADKDDGGEAQGSIRLHTRQAVRVVTTIPGDLKRDVKLDTFTVDNERAKQSFSATISNRGNVSADVNIRITLTSNFGRQIFKDGGVYPVLSGEKLDLTYQNEDMPFWGGWYQAEAVVEYNTNAAMLGFDESADKSSETKAAETIFIMPSIGALAIFGGALGLILLLIALLIGKRARANRRRKTWQKYTVYSGDSLESLASYSKVKWQMIARTNKLSAPYTLREGQVIIVPPAVAEAANASKEKREKERAEVSAAAESIEVRRPGWSSSDKKPLSATKKK